MKLALREAKKGIGRTSPNPAVGAVVVKDGRVVGKGYHRKAGSPHAEVNALRDAGGQAQGATLYVTLEPCNHTGRTPACTQAILKSGIKRVVVGMSDPNPHVDGGGTDFLAGRGISVSRGVLTAECQAINRPFMKHITTGLPWVVIKAGVSLDGRIATRTSQSGWITNELSRRQVHRLRDRVDAIAVGIGTALADDPSLTTRLPGGRGRDPLRVVLDTQLKMPPSAKMLTQKSTADTWIFCGPDPAPRKAKALEKEGAVVTPVPLHKSGQLDLQAVLAVLGKAQVTSVLFEGGSKVHGSLLRLRLADEANIFVAPVFIGGDGVPVVDALGVNAVQEAFRLHEAKTKRFGDDVLVSGLFAR